MMALNMAVKSTPVRAVSEKMSMNKLKGLSGDGLFDILKILKFGDRIRILSISYISSELTMTSLLIFCMRLTLIPYRDIPALMTILGL